MRISIVFFIISILTSHCFGEIINVPEDFETIQAAINESEIGDTVLVQPGMYMERITISGNGILVVASADDPAETIIDAEGGGTVVTFSNDGGEASILDGFTIQNGQAEIGGGIITQSSSPNLCNLIIRDNSAARGGGFYVGRDTHPIITNSLFINNTAEFMGAGIFCWGGELTLCNVTLANNDVESEWNGGGVYLQGASATFDSVYISDSNACFGAGIYANASDVVLNHVLLFDNTATSGGGLYQDGSQSGSITADHLTVVNNTASQAGGGFYGTSPNLLLCNSIFFANESNEASQIFLMRGTAVISYCDIEGGRNEMHVSHGHQLTWGDGNIDDDPQFNDPGNDDFHLTEDSPCIDTGDPESREDPDGTRTDMGAFYHNQLDVPESIADIPEEFNLFPAYPNPFNSTTTIEYALPFASQVFLNLYNLSGQRIETLANGRLQAGVHRMTLKAGDLPSGLYFVKLEGMGQSSTRKIMLIK